MSIWEELLAEKVEWKSLGEVCLEKFWIMPTTPKFKDYGIPYITGKNIKNGNIDFINIKYISKEDYKTITKNRNIKINDILISMIGTIGEVGIVNEDREFYGQNIYLLRLNNSIILNKYFFYYFTMSNVRKDIVSKKNTSSQGYVRADQLEKLQIPIPSLETQKRIVAILDKFTEYSEALKTELGLRQKQYEYYRDLLLSEEYLNKKSIELCGEGSVVEWKSLREVCDVRDGTHESPKKQDFGKYLVTSKNIKNGSVNFENAYFISEEDYENINKRSKVNINDLLFTMIGTIGEVAHIIKEPDYAIKNIGLIKSSENINSRFAFFYLQSNYTKKYIEFNKSKGSQVFLSLGNLRNMPIPIPPSKVQEHIVLVLDKFDKIANDINEGLPKEIELREKQYEYYREKLLNFKVE